MATKKQQKRRHKRMVHETYDHAAPAAGQPRRARVARNEQPAKATRRRPAPSGRQRGMRAIPEPSMVRSLRRGLFVYATLYLALGSGVLGGGQKWGTALLGAAPAALLFIPFDYYLGGFMYRRMARRTQQQQR